MTRYLLDYHGYFLLWLALILGEELEGRATEQTRIYDMGQVARYGLGAEAVRERAHEVLSKAPSALERWGFDCEPLGRFRARLETRPFPGGEMIGLFEGVKLISGVLPSVMHLPCTPGDNCW